MRFDDHDEGFGYPKARTTNLGRNERNFDDMDDPFNTKGKQPARGGVSNNRFGDEEERNPFGQGPKKTNDGFPGNKRADNMQSQKNRMNGYGDADQGSNNRFNDYDDHENDQYKKGTRREN